MSQNFAIAGNAGTDPVPNDSVPQTAPAPQAESRASLVDTPDGIFVQVGAARFRLDEAGVRKLRTVQAGSASVGTAAGSSEYAALQPATIPGNDTLETLNLLRDKAWALHHSQEECSVLGQLQEYALRHQMKAAILQERAQNFEVAFGLPSNQPRGRDGSSRRTWQH